MKGGAMDLSIGEHLSHMAPHGDNEDYKARVREVERVLTVLGLKMAGVESDMGVVKEGVANFRDFQRKNIEFMGWFKAHEERRDEREREEKERTEERNKARARIHYWWLGILSAVIVAAVIAIFTWIGNFLTTHHISASFSQPNATIQDATIPAVR